MMMIAAQERKMKSKSFFLICHLFTFAIEQNTMYMCVVVFLI